MPTPDRIVAALERLDPEDRAHLELSYRRGFGDEEIAGLVGADPSEVPALRGEAVAEMADELGEPEDEVRATLERMDESDWAGRTAEVEEEPSTAISEEPPTVVSEPRSRRVVWLLAAGAAVLLLALIVALASGGGDDDKQAKTGTKQATKKRSKGATETQPSQKPPAAGGKAVALRRLNGTYGHGTAQIVAGNKLRLRVSGFLKPTGGGYAVWLLNPPDDARRLYATTGTSIERDLDLPPDYAKYRLVEVARAVPALSSPHSSFSLLRVTVKSLGG